MSENQPDQSEHFPIDSQSPVSAPGDSLVPGNSIAPESPSAPASPQPLNPATQPADMEVHKHPHHVTHKKKWGEYLLEFLMLFLAVFLGFLAENWREHIVEHSREKEYMRTLVNDLQRDTAFLNTGFYRKQERIKAIDSVFSFFEQHRASNVVPGYVAVNIRRTSWDRLYDRNTGTINQLKNSGGLRLIRNKQVADSIAEYDLLWARADFWKQNYTVLQQLNLTLTEKMFNPYDLLAIYSSSVNAAEYNSAFRDLAAVRINSAALDEFLNLLGRQKVFTKQDYQFYMNISDGATRLIALIKKEYHLE